MPSGEAVNHCVQMITRANDSRRPKMPEGLFSMPRITHHAQCANIEGIVHLDFR